MLVRAVADAQHIEILVDTDVRVDAPGTPKKVLEALKRQLRQHGLTRLLQQATTKDASQRELLSLLQTGEQQHRLPQGLLTRVTETCRRHNVAYSVIDRRAMVSCAALRSSLRLDDDQREALRRMLLHDGGVLVAPQQKDRLTLAAELIARRQQRTLLLAESEPAAVRWRDHLSEAFGLQQPHLCMLDKIGSEQHRIVVGTFQDAARLPAAELGQRYGMVVFDALDRIDPITLMRTLRAIDARHLLGLAESAARADGLQDALFLVVGGLVHQIGAEVPQRAVQLVCRARTTAFDFPYGGRSGYQALVAALAHDEQRNRQIVADIVQEASAGNPCLVLSERRDHLEALAALLPSDLPSVQVTSGLRPAERREAITRFNSGELNVLLVTSQIAQETICTPRVSRLLISFPFSYARKLERIVQQLLQPAPDKHQAVVYDYDDAAIAPLHRAFQKRTQILERLRRQADRAYGEWAQLSLI